MTTPGASSSWGGSWILAGEPRARWACPILGCRVPPPDRVQRSGQVLLRPLPYPGPDAFQGLEGLSLTELTLTGHGPAERIRVGCATTGLLPLLQVRAMEEGVDASLGRTQVLGLGLAGLGLYGRLRRPVSAAPDGARDPRAPSARNR